MRTYSEKRLCHACGGAGCVDPPYRDYDHAAANAVSVITCPCCGGVGFQVVTVREE
jgi:hypothetical protein